MNRDQLVQALRQEWRAIPDAINRRLTNSVQSRVHACILAHGGRTRYWNMFSVVKFIHLRYKWPYMKSCCCELWYYNFMGFIEYTHVYLSLSKYNICINLCFVLFLILWKNNWYTFFWSLYIYIYIYIYIHTHINWLHVFHCSIAFLHKHIQITTVISFNSDFHSL